MGTHSLDDLMRKWQHEHLTAEQMIGQLLQQCGGALRAATARRAARGQPGGIHRQTGPAGGKAVVAG